MRPIPFPVELADVWTAAEKAEGLPYEWHRITMAPPSPTLEDGTPCDPVEALVKSALGVDAKTKAIERRIFQYVVRVGVNEADLEAMRASGGFYVGLFGEGMQPFAVFTDAGDTEPE